MVKTIWAVACAAVAAWLLVTLPEISGAASPGGGAGKAKTSPPPASPPPASAPPAASLPAPSAMPPHAGPPAGPTPPGMPSNSIYRIGPEDILHVSVWENKELTLDVVVRPDGKISLPLIQDTQAEGLTAAELAEVIQGKLREFINAPQVAVIVSQVNSPKIYVLGNVVRPGPYPLRGEMSVLQALSLAGGFTEFASKKKIRIVQTLGSKREVRKVNYFDLLEGGKEGNYLLRPGDTIVVP